MKYSLTLFCYVLFIFGMCIPLAAQNGGRISGNLEANANIFIRDEAIGAFNTPQYERQLYGGEAWLQLNYSNWGFDVGLRFDMFNNSNLLNPQGSYTDEGIGRWFISKKIKKLGFTAGYIYDQIGSGLIFRAFENRPLLIDNALYGLQATYDLTDNVRLKGFTGRQKRQFDVYGSVIKGFNAEAFFSGGGGEDGKTAWTLAPGVGIVNRTYDDNTVQTIVNTIATYSVVDSIGAQYNNYAMSVYNTLSYGKFTWYVEGAYKTKDVYFDPFATKTNRDGSTSLGKLLNEDGYVVYSTLGYATKGLAVTIEGKRTERFSLRTNPFVALNQGLINYLPPMNRFNTFRLLAYYGVATQELGEQAFQADIKYSPTRKLNFNFNFSNITDLNNDLLFREYFVEALYKYKRKWQLRGGVQVQEYNQEIFQFKPGVGRLGGIAPYGEFLYKFDRKKSIRTEFQYLYTGRGDINSATKEGLFGNSNRDFGNWIFGLVEFSVVPHWVFTISDMYNVDPAKPLVEGRELESIHFPRVDVFYINGGNRFSLSYVKQVEGVVCTGGICRVEPAFSGFRFSMTTSF